MAETKTAYLTVKDFQEQIIGWSKDTIKRRIRNDGMPAIKQPGGYVFERKEIELWFKRRSEKAG